ncbi:MAG: DHA2 family efflux MFS transporter permease subunit [Solirubrobacterales bacterium]
MPSTVTTQPSETTRSVSPWVIAMTVMLATFMEVLDTSVANVALPHIAGGLGVDVQESTWVLTSYLVSNAIVLPLSGWLSSLFGRKNFFSACVALFAASSFLCGIAPSLMSLIIFRIFQGIGGGAMQPISQAILLESFPAEKRGMAMGVFGMGVVVAPIVGPTLGGWLSDNFSWRWIFFINIPVGMLSLFMTSLFVSDPPYLKREDLAGVKIDYIGLGLICVGLGCLQIFLDKGQTEDWFSSNLIITTGTIAFVSLTVLIVWELVTASPVIELRLLKDRNFSMGVVSMFTLGFILYGSLLLLPVFLQQLLGYSAMLAGMVLSPGGILTLIMMPIVGALVARVQARYLIMIGLVVVGYSMFYMAGFNLQIDFWTAVKSRSITGAGLAFLFVPINAAAFYYIAKEKTGQGTAIINLTRNIGGSVGIAFVTTLLARGTQMHQGLLVHNLTPLNPLYSHALGHIQAGLIQRGVNPTLAQTQASGVIQSMLVRQASIKAYGDVFQILGLISFALVPFLFLLKKTKPGAGAPPGVH